MAEYIEREALLLRLNDIWLTAKPTDTMYDDDRQLAMVRCMGLNDAMDAVKSIPAADVRPVVLCKECKHYEQLDLFRNSPVWSGMCHYWNSHATREDGFCFKAAKKEES